MTTTIDRSIVVHDRTTEFGIFTLTSDSPGSVSLSESEYFSSLRAMAELDLDSITQIVRVGTVTICPMGRDVYRLGRTDNVLSNILTDRTGLDGLKKVAEHYTSFGFLESIRAD